MRIIFSLVLALSTFLTSAQYATPEVLATAGGSAIVGDIEIAWTLGEAIISTLEGDANTLTNGLHQTSEFCFGDFNFDGQINAMDLLIFLPQLGCSNICFADLNNDLFVNTTDLLILLSIYGTTCFGDI